MRIPRFAAALGVAAAVLLGGAGAAGAATLPTAAVSHTTQATADRGGEYRHVGDRGWGGREFRRDRGRDGRWYHRHHRHHPRWHHRHHRHDYRWHLHR
ncbi:hypothetical protein PV392_18750 [Streptomyces sp. ME03-5709C]|nr:hypothetical protein [Streptomyces sp. ME03-5709C]